MSYPQATPHSHPEALAEDLFVVYGSVQINALMRFSRNMAIVRNGSELTLVSAVRVDEPGLAALDALGTVKHVVRLGPLHGMDDPFYLDRYGAEFWSLPGGTQYTTPAINHPLTEGGPLPFPDAELFEFHGIAQPEGALLLKHGAGTLLTVDSIQSYATPPHKPHTGIVARLLSQFRGFPNETLIGPIWTQMLAADKQLLRSEFERLLELDFDQLLSAHGTFLPSGARLRFATRSPPASTHSSRNGEILTLRPAAQHAVLTKGSYAVAHWETVNRSTESELLASSTTVKRVR